MTLSPLAQMHARVDWKKRRLLRSMIGAAKQPRSHCFFKAFPEKSASDRSRIAPLQARPATPLSRRPTLRSPGKRNIQAATSRAVHVPESEEVTRTANVAVTPNISTADATPLAPPALTAPNPFPMATKGKAATATAPLTTAPAAVSTAAARRRTGWRKRGPPAFRCRMLRRQAIGMPSKRGFREDACDWRGVDNSCVYVSACAGCPLPPSRPRQHLHRSRTKAGRHLAVVTSEIVERLPHLRAVWAATSR